MKKNVMKTMVATICVVAAGMGGMKAYNSGNLSETSMLLAENVEALTQLEFRIPCLPANNKCTYNATMADGTPVTATAEPAILAAPFR